MVGLWLSTEKSDGSMTCLMGLTTHSTAPTAGGDSSFVSGVRLYVSKIPVGLPTELAIGGQREAVLSYLAVRNAVYSRQVSQFSIYCPL